MRKIRLLLEYDGTDYHGWQIQNKGLTIQGIIEEGVFRITGEQTRVVGASRTDAGVHALGQVAAFRTKSRLEPEKIKSALNAVLPYDIRILEASEADDSFRPIYGAVKKSYFYLISNQGETSAFLYRYTLLVKQPLEIKSMISAAKLIVGKHDFSAFKGVGSSIKDPVREIFSLDINRLESIGFMTSNMKGDFVRIGIEANGFLRHMVRNIVGTLVEIGRGRFSAEKMPEILKSRDRRLAGPTAPPCGLFLEKIVY
ncbi:MAG: tRNA pseudouridine(38-40) synthase TruA [Nitrospirae bacterium RBG_13_39_12]|nr:MAG: tRNA pseudouridine(38-40) synthase TruA [Nitrospirae bacterium RBG_13_39_12]